MPDIEMSQNDKESVCPNCPYVFGAMSVSEFADRYGICRSTFYNWEPEDQPFSFMIGGRRFIPFSEIREWEKRMLQAHGYNPAIGRLPANDR